MHSFSIYSDDDIISKVKTRVIHSLKNNGLLMDLSTEHCRKFLQRKVNSKTRVVVMYIDINGSTQMSRDLPSTQLSLIIQIFSQEISLAIINFGGYVLKFVGDAVIALFPAEYNPEKVLTRSIICASSILEIIKGGICPVFKNNLLPEITVKIGIEYGDAIVLAYGKNVEFAHLDVIGFSISIASKITSLASPNEIIVGENAYNYVEPIVKENFIDLTLDKEIKWDNIMKYNNKMKYRIFSYKKRF